MRRHVDSAIPNDAKRCGLHDACMPQLRDLQDHDLQGLSPEAVTALAQQMLQRLREQDRDIAQRDQHIER